MPLVGLIHRAATHGSGPVAEFVEALSRELGDPAVSMNLALPGRPATRFDYRVHSPAKFAGVFAEYLARGEVPWPMGRESADRFVRGAARLPEAALRATAFFQNYMAPQGFACEPCSAACSAG